eukprot:COSAG02_NODE_15166_length_1197_cov_238.369763_1_plen_166_part_00
MRRGSWTQIVCCRHPNSLVDRFNVRRQADFSVTSQSRRWIACCDDCKSRQLHAHSGSGTVSVPSCSFMAPYLSTHVNHCCFSTSLPASSTYFQLPCRINARINFRNVALGMIVEVKCTGSYLTILRRLGPAILGLPYLQPKAMRATGPRFLCLSSSQHWASSWWA